MFSCFSFLENKIPVFNNSRNIANDSKSKKENKNEHEYNCQSFLVAIM